MKAPGWFDFPMACLGAVVSAVLVGWVNIEHGGLAAVTAATKQACYAFVATGLILQFSRWLAGRRTARPLAMATAVLIPLLVTVLLLYVVHSLKGTAEPLYSIIPGTVLSLIGLLLVTWKTMSVASAPLARRGHALTATPEDS